MIAITEYARFNRDIVIKTVISINLFLGPNIYYTFVRRTLKIYKSLKPFLIYWIGFLAYNLLLFLPTFPKFGQTQFNTVKGVEQGNLTQAVLKRRQANSGVGFLGTNKDQLLNRIQSVRTFTNLQYFRQK